METLTKTRNNVQIVQQAFADFLSGNIQGILDECTDDIVWAASENPDVPYAGTFKGKEGVVEFFSTLSENVDYSSFEPKEFFSNKDAVVVLGHHTGAVKKTGKTYDHDFSMVFRFRDEKLYHFFAFVDALDQANAFK